MEPMYKAPEMVEVLESMMGRTTHIKQDTCVFCHQQATFFRDDISRKEYRISGICQTCQDVFFGEE